MTHWPHQPPLSRPRPRPRRRLTLTRRLSIALAVATAAAACGVQAATPAELLAGYRSAAGAAPDPARGREFFVSSHGREWQCASCHGAVPTQDGRHAATGKAIAPLAPAFNPQRFTDPVKVEKWFGRNCRDVVGRACSAGEKADVLAWLTGLGR